MNIFIDVNIFLSFLETTGKDEIKTLDELEKLINTDKVKLIFPKISRDEFIRRIPEVSSEFCKKLTFLHNLSDAPIIKEEKSIKEKIDSIRKQYSELVKEYKKKYLDNVENIKNRIVKNLIKKSFLPKDETIYYEFAKNRKLLGNPPGTGGTIGDQLSWEILLNEYLSENLTVVTNDGSWKNATDETKINPFLEYEWKERTNKKIFFYQTLGEFINNFNKKEVISKQEIKREEQRTTSIANSGIQLTLGSTIGTSNGSISSRARIINRSAGFGTSPFGTAMYGGGTTLAQVTCRSCGFPITIDEMLYDGLCADCK